jgi:hypothetical protein
LLDDFEPAPSRREPASVGLKHLAQNGLSTPPSKLHADWSCRPWSELSMNSLPFQWSESTAPARRSVAVMTMFDEPVRPRRYVERMKYL